MTRLKGHTLLGEGTSRYASRSCGTESPHLPSQGKRRAWHRQHKTEVSAALTG